MLTFRKKRALLNDATIPAPCQVRSETESPCPNLAVAEIRGVTFCESCAREQEAYFAIGELVAREEARGPRGRALAEALGRVRRESAGDKEGIAAGTRRGPSSIYETKRRALRAG